jgi:hypothetical protein
VNDIPIPSRDEGSQVFEDVLAHYDAPAYVRRARRVEAAYEDLLARCRQQRDEWLALVRVRLGTLRALAGSWEALAPYLEGGETRTLEGLYADLAPRLRVPVAPTSSARALRTALQELCESLERFNRRWLEFVRGLDLGALNAERADYNRYFLLEKECALRLPHVARFGYKPLEPLTAHDLLALFPALPTSKR